MRDVGAGWLQVYRLYVAHQRELLALMRRIDELHLCCPFMGSRQLRDQLATEGFRVSRKKVQRLMLEMGLKALSSRTKTSFSAGLSRQRREAASWLC